MHITRVSLRIPGGTLELILVPDSEPPPAAEAFVETEGTEVAASVQPMPLRSCRRAADFANVLPFRRSA